MEDITFVEFLTALGFAVVITAPIAIWVFKDTIRYLKECDRFKHPYP